MEISPEVMAKLEVARKERAETVAQVWRDDLSHKDWLFDGSPIRGKVMLARFNNLDWDRSWIDLGPSVAGNLGPYWHVPLKETIIDGEVYDDGDTVHRLYPKALKSKWAMLILHACYEVQRKTKERIEHAIDHCEPEFIQSLANEHETLIADNMRYEILQKVRSLA